MYKILEVLKIIPKKWEFKIKKFPDGRKRKFKSIFGVRGDLQEMGFILLINIHQ